MAQIDTSKWAAFDLTELFDFSLPKGDLQVKKVSDGKIPLITPSNTNNGLIQRISDLSESTLYDANKLTVDMFGNAYYQDEQFFVTAHGHVNVLIPKFSMNKYIGLFLATSIKSMFRRKYGFSDMCTQKVLKVEKIILPISSDGTPDWLFMEDFIKSKESNVKDAISILSSTEEMKKEVIDTKQWVGFEIGKLFSIKRPIARSRMKYEQGNTPFVASGNYNNGIVEYLQPKENEVLDKGNCITVSPLDGSSFYQKSDFLGRGGAGSAIIILYNDKLNEYNGLFIAAAIRRSLVKYSYNDQLSSGVIVSEKVYLPVDIYNEPDWVYMENYMRSVEKKAQNNIELLNM